MVVGDIVYLNSGSPPMTLVSTKGGEFGTNWMSGSTLYSGVFLEVCLTTKDPLPEIEVARQKTRAALENVE